MERRDLVAGSIALALHAGAGLALSAVKQHSRSALPTLLALDLRRNPPPPALPPPEPPPPTEPPRAPPKKNKRLPALAPIPNQTAQPPPTAPPKPVFGISEQSVASTATFSLPVGNTTTADPRTAGPPAPPLPAPPTAAPAAVFQSASAFELKSQPEVDEESCRIPYPDGEAKQSGLEGDTIMRVEIDAQGKVHAVRLVKGVGHGLDEAARHAIQHRCRFTAARNSYGPVPFTITYTYHWIIDH